MQIQRIKSSASETIRGKARFGSVMRKKSKKSAAPEPGELPDGAKSLTFEVRHFESNHS